MKELCEDDYVKILGYIARKVTCTFHKRGYKFRLEHVCLNGKHAMRICADDEHVNGLDVDWVQLPSAKEYYEFMHKQALSDTTSIASNMLASSPEELLIAADLDVE